MTQKDPKRPGSRDISELKARLGLKKAGPAGAAPGAAAGKPNGSVVPPPGLNLPPPPGARPPGPAIPNAADDPFGAMNAMASYQATQRAPEIVIVNDGKPVESVGTGKRLATIGKYVAIALVPLIMGLVVGQIAKENKIYNAGIKSAKGVATDVKRVRDAMGEIKKSFEESEKFYKDRKVAKELTAKLDQLKEKLANNKVAVFAAKQNTLNADLTAQILVFYSQAQIIQDLIEMHLTNAQMEEAAIAMHQAQADQLKSKDGSLLKDQGYLYKVGIVLTNPEVEEGKKAQGEHARIVEIGAALCGDPANLNAATLNETGSCGDQPLAGFRYRYRAGDDTQWLKAKLHIPDSLTPGDDFPLNEIILPQQEVGVAGIVSTPEVGLSEVSYFDRLKKLRDLVTETYTNAEKLQDDLAKKGNEKPRFTFLL